MAHKILADVSGRVWKIEAASGATVARGAILMILESMKMEIPVEAPRAGVVRLMVAEGEVVAEGQALAEIG